MSTSAPRWIVVDDTATDMIHYSGPWFTDTSGSQDGSASGPVYQETLHGANNDASLSFAFIRGTAPLTVMPIYTSTGTQVKVIGTNNMRDDNGILDPVWECFVDDVSIGGTAPFYLAENNWEFCNSQSKISDGSHVLTVNATVAKSQTFWIDQIQYLPSASVPVDNLTILIDSSDPELAGAYGTGWEGVGSTANMTTTTGSQFTFDFIGISLSWYGFIPIELPIAATTGLSSKNSSTLYNEKFFQTPTLSVGKHRIIVTFQGSGTTTPLTLDYLVTQNASVPSTTTTPTPTSSTSSGNSNSGTSRSKSNVEAIAGGIGGGAVLLLVILTYLFIRRNNRELRSRLIERDIDASVIPRPFVDAFVSLAEIIADDRRWRKGGGQVARNQTMGSIAAKLRVRGPAAAPLLQAVSLQSHLAPAPQASTSTLPSPGDSAALRYVHHADSGIRLPSAAETERIVDVPPEYTLS